MALRLWRYAELRTEDGLRFGALQVGGLALELAHKAARDYGSDAVTAEHLQEVRLDHAFRLQTVQDGTWRRYNGCPAASPGGPATTLASVTPSLRDWQQGTVAFFISGPAQCPGPGKYKSPLFEFLKIINPGGK